ncbi:MAG: hypothetical protein OER80_14060 [Gammaproteobacteria bacterium]|nr:hypothetical protein [Gammaproteobacteria bacterium]
MSHSQTEGHVRAVLTEDNSEVRDKFWALLQDELEEIVPLLAQSLDAAADFFEFADGNEYRGKVAWFIFSALQGYLISLRLLLDGLLLQSGNAQRQTLENIGMALVCSYPDLDILEHFEADQYSPSSAIQDAIRNADKLGANKEAIETIKQSSKFYDQFSHASKMTIALYSNFSEVQGLDIGGMYDPAKEQQYRKEGQARVRLARILPSFIAGVRKNASRSA